MPSRALKIPEICLGEKEEKRKERNPVITVSVMRVERTRGASDPAPADASGSDQGGQRDRHAHMKPHPRPQTLLACRDKGGRELCVSAQRWKRVHLPRACSQFLHPSKPRMPTGGPGCSREPLRAGQAQAPRAASLDCEAAETASQEEAYF